MCKKRAKFKKEGKHMTFSERAKPLKDKGKITLKQIADACNISESMVSRYLNGVVVPPEDIARNILEVLQLAADAEPQAAPLPDLASFYMSALESQRAAYESSLSDARTDKRRWFIVAIILIVFIMFLLGWDITHPDMGYIRY